MLFRSALIKTTQIKRTLLTVTALILIGSTSFGQGLLIEGAGNLIKSLLTKTEETSVFVLANGYEEAKVNVNLTAFSDFTNKVSTTLGFDSSEKQIDFTPEIIESIVVSDVYVSFENNVSTESWMTESFTNQMETQVKTESWMTESFSTQMEADVETESWMIESFSTQMEADVETESWMSDSFTEKIESPLTVQSWMTSSFYDGDLEKELEVEDWMTESLLATVAETESAF